VPEKPSGGFEIVVKGDGGDDGGGGGGGGGTSSAQSEADARRKRARAFEDYLISLRINPGPFGELIDRAAQNEWSSARLLVVVGRSKEFSGKAGMFPGIKRLFKEGMSVTAAVSEWRRRATAFRDMQDQLDLHAFPLTKRRVGLAIKGGLTPERLALRFQVREILDESEPIRQAYLSLLTPGERAKLDRLGWFKALAREGDRSLADRMEAARFLASGLDITAEQALGAARAIGPAGEFVGDISELVGRVMAYRDRALPELRAAGVLDVDLLLLEQGADPKGIGPTVDRILAQREAVRGFGQAAPRQRTQQTGVPALFGVVEEGL